MASYPTNPCALLDRFAPVFTQPDLSAVPGPARAPRSSPPAGAPSPTCSAPPARSPPGHVSSYHRVLSQARWSSSRLACALARLVLALLPADGPIVLVGDDTVDGHPGQARLRQGPPPRPGPLPHAYTAWRYGHKWVVLAVLVRFPFATRPWALPVLVALYRSEEDDRARAAPPPHPGPAHVPAAAADAPLVPRPPLRLRRRFGLRHPRGRPVLPPPPRPARPWSASSTPTPTCSSRRRPTRGKGRPRVKGARLPKPREAVAAARRLQAADGRLVRRRAPAGSRRSPARATGTRRARAWCRSAGCSSATATGTHRDEYFFTTDAALDVRRRSSATTPAAGTSRPPSRKSARCLRPGDDAGLVPRDGAAGRRRACSGCTRSWRRSTTHCRAARRVGAIAWPGKTAVTFSDALTAVRRWIWSDGVFSQVQGGPAVAELPAPLRQVLYSALAPAA